MKAPLAARAAVRMKPSAASAAALRGGRTVEELIRERRVGLAANPLAGSSPWGSVMAMQAPSTANPPAALTEDRLLRPEQAAWYLNVKTSWVYEAVRAGRLPCHRVGRHIRFTRPMLDDWLSEQPRQ
jgi:excisionase family DNA binding protein